jgi:hypothetical protein
MFGFALYMLIVHGKAGDVNGGLVVRAASITFAIFSCRFCIASQNVIVLCFLLLASLKGCL